MLISSVPLCVLSHAMMVEVGQTIPNHVSGKVGEGFLAYPNLGPLVILPIW